MRLAGCAATSHEIAAVFGGDDIVVRARGDLIDPAEARRGQSVTPGLGGRKYSAGSSEPW
jgi:hypothetical protein